MQKKSQDFPEMPGESLQERKARRKKWLKLKDYRERLAAGFCGRCGRERPVGKGATCSSCRKQISKWNNRRDTNPQVCSKCGKANPEDGKSCCRPCLDKQKVTNRQRRSTPTGNWINCVRRATLDLSNGRCNNGKRIFKSKWLNWDHFDFAKAFPNPGEGSDLDHIIPLACAETLNGQVDPEFAKLVSNLSNLQYISHQANVLKAQNQDKQAIQRAKDLRAQGVHGAKLFHDLWAEFAWPDRTGKEA